MSAYRNQPCFCGSGKKYKKCCFHKEQEEAASANSPSDSGGKSSPQKRYRFKRGDYVLAYHNKDYQPGLIVALNYWEPGWKDPVPYQIMLKDGIYANRLIYAPLDEDRFVKALPEDWARFGSNVRMIHDRPVGKRRLRA